MERVERFKELLEQRDDVLLDDDIKIEVNFVGDLAEIERTGRFIATLTKSHRENGYMKNTLEELEVKVSELKDGYDKDYSEIECDNIYRLDQDDHEIYVEYSSNLSHRREKISLKDYQNGKLEHLYENRKEEKSVDDAVLR